jgi:hypothetical protein
MYWGRQVTVSYAVGETFDVERYAGSIGEAVVASW